MKKLTRDEMKNVVGGLQQACHCTCSGSVGAWTYTSEPSGSTISSNIATYCSTGQATCGGCSNIGS